MRTNVTVFTPYPFVIGEKINIAQGPRHGDWLVAALDETKITLRCPVSGKEFSWAHFCYKLETREQKWPQEIQNDRE
jgi:hypothetical protein